MTRDTIERAIKKAAGEGGTDNYQEVRYEGYGPAGVAVIVEALTDNRNRTASEVRHAFTKFGGALGATGAVAWSGVQAQLVSTMIGMSGPATSRAAVTLSAVRSCSLRWR